MHKIQKPFAILQLGCKFGLNQMMCGAYQRRVYWVMTLAMGKQR